MKIHSKQRNQPNSNIVWHQMCEIFIIIPLVTAKKCEISTLTLDHWNKMCWKKLLFQLWSRSHIMSSMYNVPRVKANADQCLQHHQGCPETQKSADVICEQPLIRVETNDQEVSTEPNLSRKKTLSSIASTAAMVLISSTPGPLLASSASSSSSKTASVRTATSRRQVTALRQAEHSSDMLCVVSSNWFYIFHVSCIIFHNAFVTTALVTWPRQLSTTCVFWTLLLLSNASIIQ